MSEVFNKKYYDYEIGEGEHSNWFKAKPYCFRVNYNGDDLNFYLPINPSNLSISTHFATNVISTVYGTVEEHSEQRYFDIVIAGTTGMAPHHYEYEPQKSTDNEPILEDNAIDRTRAESAWGAITRVASAAVLGANNTTKGIGRESQVAFKSSTGGFFNKTQALLSNTVNKVTDIFGTKEEKYKSAVDAEKSGYLAFHNFYRFLLAYKKIVVGRNNTRKRGGHPILFINYKDNNQYNVAIQTFQLTRSVDDPMLYKYSITMRGYKLSKIGDPSYEETDKAADLGLDGVDSISAKAKMSNIARNAKNALSSAVGAFKGFGS